MATVNCLVILPNFILSKNVFILAKNDFVFTWKTQKKKETHTGLK